LESPCLVAYLSFSSKIFPTIICKPNCLQNLKGVTANGWHLFSADIYELPARCGTLLKQKTSFFEKIILELYQPEYC
jgi:hypothetical protein